MDCRNHSTKRRRTAVVFGAAVAVACGALAVVAARRRASSSSFPIEFESSSASSASSVRGAAGHNSDVRDDDRRARETRRRRATGVVRPPQEVQPVQVQSRPRVRQQQQQLCHELNRKKCKQAMGCEYNDLAGACMPSLPGTPGNMPDLSGVCQFMNTKQCKKDPNCALWGPNLDVCVDAVHVVAPEPVDEPTDEPDDNDLVPLYSGDNDGDDPCPGKPANKCRKAKECRWYRKKQECRRKPNANDKGDGGGAAGAAMIEPQARSDSEDYFNYLQDVAAAGEAAEAESEEDSEPTFGDPLRVSPDGTAECAAEPDAAALGLDACAEHEFCELEIGTCDPPGGGTTTRRGTCLGKPEMCPMVYAPVCGCDGETYDNLCFAHGAGVSVARHGECDHPPPAERIGPKEVKSAYMDADAELTDGVEAEVEPQSVDAAEEEPEPAFGDPPPNSPSKRCAIGPDAASLGLDTCAENEFCRLDDWTCVAHDVGATYRGECARRSEDCPMLYVPVCGCNGRLYNNPCYANRAGVSVARYGKCGRPPGEKIGLKEVQAADTDAVAEHTVNATGEEPDPTFGDPPPDSPAKKCAVGPDAASLGLDTCSEHEFCRLDDWTCDPHDVGATHRGECVREPKTCPTPYFPVCGCNGMPYNNPCYAHRAGVSIALYGKCGRPPPVEKIGAKEDGTEEGADEHRPERYWPVPAERGSPNGFHDCVRSSDYPDNYSEPHNPPLLFDTRAECCAAYPCARPERYWPVPAKRGTAFGTHDCVRSADYPDSYARFHDHEGQMPGRPYLFDTLEECCAAYPCARPEKYWPAPAKQSTEYGIHDCLYSSDYLDSYFGDHEGPMLFDTYEECCDAYPCAADAKEAGAKPQGAVEAVEAVTVVASAADGSVPMVDSLPAPTGPTGQQQIEQQATGMAEAIGGWCSDDSHCEGGSICDPSSATCACDYDSDAVDGSNGCPVGEVCRMPCATSGGGPRCFESDDVRDCGDAFGDGYVCMDGGDDGAKDENDGGMGCVEAAEGTSPSFHQASGALDEMRNDGPVPLPDDHPLNEMLNQLKNLPSPSDDMLDELLNGIDPNTLPPDYPLGELLSGIDLDDPSGELPNDVDPMPSPSEDALPSDGTGLTSTSEDALPSDGTDLTSSSSDVPKSVAEAASSFEALPEEDTAAQLEPAHDSMLDDLLNEIVPEPLPLGDPALMSEGTDTSESPLVPQSIDGPMTQLDATVPNDAGTFPAPDATETPTPLEDFPSEDQAVAATTTVATVTSTIREEYWFPHLADRAGHCIFGNDYPDLYTADGRSRETFLFGSYVDCCAAFPEGCVETTTAPATEALAEKPETHSAHSTRCEWHIGTNSLNTCTNSGDYPAIWDDMSIAVRRHYFFSTAEACCEGTQFGEDCNVVDECAGGGGVAAKADAASSGSCEWHIDVREHKVCTNSGDYPEEWEAREHREHFLFATAEECCETRFLGLDCKVVDECVEERDEEARNVPPSGCEWHLDVDRHLTCTNSKDYPAEWDAGEHREHFLFATAEECCEARFPGLAECGKVDACAGEFLRLELHSHTTDLPWDFGDPPQWEIDDSVSLPAEHPYALSWERDWVGLEALETASFDSYSMTNIPAEGLGAASDLTLRVRVPEGHVAMARCVALIDVQMPFDNFYVLVNGRARQRYTNREEGWTELLVGFEEGLSTLTFRVENGWIMLGFERTEDFGTGRVWLDQCQILSYNHTLP